MARAGLFRRQDFPPPGAGTTITGTSALIALRRHGRLWAWCYLMVLPVVAIYAYHPAQLSQGGTGEKYTKISGILAVAIALIAAGKLSVTVAATYSRSTIKDAVAHLEWGSKLLPDAGQM